jgi:hypothetical protein
MAHVLSYLQNDRHTAASEGTMSDNRTFPYQRRFLGELTWFYPHRVVTKVVKGEKVKCVVIGSRENVIAVIRKVHDQFVAYDLDGNHLVSVERQHKAAELVCHGERARNVYIDAALDGQFGGAAEAWVHAASNSSIATANAQAQDGPQVVVEWPTGGEVHPIAAIRVDGEVVGTLVCHPAGDELSAEDDYTPVFRAYAGGTEDQRGREEGGFDRAVGELLDHLGIFDQAPELTVVPEQVPWEDVVLANRKVRDDALGRAREALTEALEANAAVHGPSHLTQEQLASAYQQVGVVQQLFGWIAKAESGEIT